MSSTSRIHLTTISSITPVIDDSNFHNYVTNWRDPQTGTPILRGHTPRPYDQVPEGELGPFASSFPHLIPEDEWDDRIEEKDRTQSGLYFAWKQSGMAPLNQNGTNYCWCNGVVTAIQLTRIVNNAPFIEYSPASVAAPIKGYRNQGGWGGEALDYIVNNGILPAQYWPVNAIKRQYDTPESREERKKHKITEWYELQARNFNQLMTAVLLDFPVAVGYNWWQHEVCAIRPVKIGIKQYGIGILNSWGISYGDNGYAVLTRSKATPDDAVCPATFNPITT